MRSTATKKWMKLGIITSLILVTVSFTGCKKDDEPVQPQNNIVQLVVNNPEFSFLEAAVIKADLVGALSGAGPLTVFAPTNQAFIAAGFANEAAVSALSKETLVSILTYHVVGSRILSSQIQTASNTPVQTLAQTNIFVTKDQRGVFVNGAQVTQADVQASNGVIHVINKVLMPAVGNIVQAAQGNANLSYLVAAVLRASEGTTNVAAALSAAGPLTVFAPTNQAFINAGFATTAAIQAASPATLTSILTYHVISARVLSSDLTEGATPATLNGGTVTITLSGGAKVRGRANTSASNIIAADVITTNGVVHVIDQVLLP
ncbi:immunogenic protein MPT70 [Pedobacter glucosidilyticus]|uniref:Fasciclin domain-containing protein n=1 Tax=Pedobacter aquae TaxID=2605747 RepID=A0A5C0VE83_9SPHI|nr:MULTISPECIES: fasciclin domain-containing protein [Pedobacter]KHJ37949.1 immunogenic protein MPT70 [Pedobacter glucosidilyticus]QEK50756.1 fasciclin domain-containing protein [Pedobacter aquae]